MIVDTSAIVTAWDDEPARARCEEIIAENACVTSSMSYLEASIVQMHRRGEDSLASLDTWLEAAVSPSFRSALLRRGSPETLTLALEKDAIAALNLGDCATYALAMERGEPVLYRGEDFGLTDVLYAKLD